MHDEHVDPIVPKPVRACPYADSGRAPMTTEERDNLLDGHWIPFDNSKLARSTAYRRPLYAAARPSAAEIVASSIANTGANRAPHGPKTVYAKAHMQKKPSRRVPVTRPNALQPPPITSADLRNA